MVADYRAGLQVDRFHEASDRAAGRFVTCPTLYAYSAHDDMEELYGDPLAIWRAWVDGPLHGFPDRLRPPHGRGGAGAACGRPDGVPVRVEFLKALAHPLRLRVIDRLGHRGPAPVSQLAVELDATLPELSNGLRQLRDAGIVVAERDGRHMVYALADDRLPALLDKLVPASPAPARRSPSRTCYDHLAGPLGVALYRGLVDARRAGPRRRRDSGDRRGGGAA